MNLSLAHICQRAREHYGMGALIVAIILLPFLSTPCALAPYNMGAHVPGFVRICSAEWVQWLSAYFSNSLSPLAQPPTWVALVQAGWRARGPRASSVPPRIHPPPAVDQEHSKMTINSICIILSNICLDFSSLLFRPAYKN